MRFLGRDSADGLIKLMESLNKVAKYGEVFIDYTTQSNENLEEE